jgi:hypothetical protein
LLKGRWKTEGTRAFFQEKNNYQKKKKNHGIPTDQKPKPRGCPCQDIEEEFQLSSWTTESQSHPSVHPSLLKTSNLLSISLLHFNNILVPVLEEEIWYNE